MPYNYEVLPGGHTPENATKALKRAVKNGFPEESVLTRSDGSFLIPVEEVDADEPLNASEAVIDAWENDEASRQGGPVPFHGEGLTPGVESLTGSEYKLNGPEATEEQVKANAPEDEGDGIDGKSVAELDDFIEENDLEVAKSLNKPDKIAAIRAALAEKE